MTERDLTDAISESERFLLRARQITNAESTGPCKVRAAVKRSALDLKNALSKLNK